MEKLSTDDYQRTRTLAICEAQGVSEDRYRRAIKAGKARAIRVLFWFDVILYC